LQTLPPARVVWGGGGAFALQLQNFLKKGRQINIINNVCAIKGLNWNDRSILVLKLIGLINQDIFLALATQDASRYFNYKISKKCTNLF